MAISLSTEWNPRGKAYLANLDGKGETQIAETSAYGTGVKVRFFDNHHPVAESLLQLNEDGFFYCSKWETADWAVLAVAAEASK